MSLFSVHPGTIGLIFFLIFFTFVLIWTFRPGAKKEHEQNATIPFREEK